MTKEDINNIIQALCPNNDDFEKPIISPAYLKTELEALALEQKPCGDVINRAEALKAINEMDIPEDMCVFEIKSHIGVKIGVLPPVTPQPCSNAIDRDKAIRIASGYCHPANVAKELAKLPPVTPEPKVGHWIAHPEIETSTPEYLMFYECSECGDKQCFCKTDIHKKRFCTNCGAKMQEAEK